MKKRYIFLIGAAAGYFFSFWFWINLWDWMSIGGIATVADKMPILLKMGHFLGGVMALFMGCGLSMAFQIDKHKD